MPLFLVDGKCLCGLIHLLVLVICQTEAFAVCENYSPPEGFKEEDLYHLLEKVGTPSGAGDLGKGYKLLYNTLLSQLAQVMVQRHTLMCRLQKRMARGT
jgi:hypothetical protein